MDCGNGVRTARLSRALLFGAACTLALFAAGAGGAQNVEPDVQRCIDVRNHEARKLARSQSREVARCVRDRDRGRLGGLEVGECLDEDRSGRVARAQVRLEARSANRCAAPPTFGPTDLGELIGAARERDVLLVHELFGAELGDGLSTPGSGGARCQWLALKAVQRCADRRAAEFRRCKKQGLADGSVTDQASLAEVCTGSGAAGQPDPGGRIARVCDDPNRAIASVLERKCSGRGVELAEAFAGCGMEEGASVEQVTSCLAARAACRSCRLWSRADHLSRDCDRFDDSEANGSCEATGPTCGDGQVEGAEECDPPGTGVCGSGESCDLACRCRPESSFRGARSFKSGPIQISADGRTVWVVNPDHDSVARIDTSTHGVTEVALPASGGPHRPRALSVSEDGSEVWVACHDSDRIFVLSGASGAVQAEIALPWGSGPAALALSPDQSRALVSLHRARSLAVLDVAGRSVETLLAPVFHAPLGIAWTEDGAEAWVTHVFASDEHPFISRVDFAGAAPRVTTQLQAFAADPRHSSSLAPPFDVAEGGYLTFRGHPAQIPSAGGRNELWLPTQYNNITEDVITPDSTAQATLRHLDLATRTMLQDNDDKVILSALHVHDPVASGNPYRGPGWNAGVAGPVDIAFSSDGSQVVVLFELSGDLVVVPSSLPAVRPAGAADLVEIQVGERPLGVAASPTSGLAYVANRLSRDVSVVDLAAQSEILRLPTTPQSVEPHSNTFRTGARLFHSAADPRTSSNGKVACATCHIGGEQDGRSWAFQHLPGLHGPRETPSLLALGRHFGPRDPQTGFGQLHVSGDRDEVQDFEHTFRGVQTGGAGFLGGAAQPDLGAPNAGRSADLDAVAHYLLNLEPVARSPHRGPGGALSEAAVRGATMFSGTSPATRTADAGCIACHVPETGFSDLGFHDVGQRRPNNERELNASSRSPYQWHTNTTTLLGLWLTPPYGGVAGWAATLEDVVMDIAGRNGHGTPGALTGRQKADLVAFLSSIDGDLTASDVRDVRDTDPPRVVRVEPASASAIDVWFDESVRQSSAESLANWSVLGPGGAPVAVTAAVWDDESGDRVRLFVSLTAGDPVPNDYTVVPGAILDAADTTSGGVANPLDTTDPANTKSFSLGATLTITLGASGQQNLRVPVHDAGMVGPGLSNWSHDSPWLYPVSGGRQNKGFLRFDWRAAFAAATGVASASDILDVEIDLEPDFGESQTVELRRCLQPWSDPSTGGDWNQSPNGGPTWRDHAHPSGRWNQAGAEARSAGIQGDDASHYGGAQDLAFAPDAVATLQAINEPLRLSGPALTDAFRFWFDHPALDHGYALSLAPGSTHETRFEGWDRRLHSHGPVLRITYRLP